MAAALATAAPPAGVAASPPAVVPVAMVSPNVSVRCPAPAAVRWNRMATPPVGVRAVVVADLSAQYDTAQAPGTAATVGVV